MGTGPSNQPISYLLLGKDDARILAHVADGVFDHEVDPSLAAQFLGDERHHLAVALDGGMVVGFASALDYVHPDKPRELWINEVGVAPSHRNRGVGRAVLGLLLEEAQRIGCHDAWVLTNSDNESANALYRSVGGDVGQGQRMYSFSISQTASEDRRLQDGGLQ